MKVFQRFSRGEAAPVRNISTLNPPRYRGQRGASAIEYAIILAIIGVAIVLAVQSGVMDSITDLLDTQISGITDSGDGDGT
ncbi:Flp family type IVb pilin [Halomonas sp. DP1Y21-3]|uniref:Flp family type IVb pilin n=1 Tax=Halomonas sp. DP1Y21-3 TaxID=2859080 RepID=UPI001C97501F|nr:Flp family type IVb pilin [Halomonas sp. DP1Y21-3]MBY6109722.1 Flp family type IVb pilin [Halomonas sp. DP1Y21-3]